LFQKYKGQIDHLENLEGIEGKITKCKRRKNLNIHVGKLTFHSYWVGIIRMTMQNESTCKLIKNVRD